MKFRIALAAIGFVAVSTVVIALAKEETTSKPTGREKDEQQIRAASQALARAFATGDGKTIADFWTDEGEYIDDRGEVVRGRAALTTAYTGFATRRTRVEAEAKTESVRFLGKDIAVEDGVFTVRGPGAPAVSTQYSTLYVRQDGRWQIALLKEQSDRSVKEPELADLEWLIGTWQSEGDEAQARITYEWTDNKRFIKATFSVKPRKSDAKATSGNEMIGVDPTLGVIRGWTFDDSGAFGETFWKWDHGRWAIEAKGTQSDRSQSTAVNLLTRSGDDTFTWRSVDRTNDGDRLPDLPTVKVTRVSAKDHTTTK
jgi:uncharacterized protein (TIGR02246 family)